MKIVPLSEGSYTIDHTKEFVPFNKYQDDLQSRPIGSLLVEIQPFVVITKNDTIILDCGLGYSNHSGILNIHENLVKNDIDPMSVTKVLLSHLHKDHAGGIGKYDSILKQTFLSFPNATYYVNKQELQIALTPGNSSYKKEQIEVLEKNANHVVLLEDNGKIDDYITYKKTSAHSIFHTIFWIEENNEVIFFGADDAPQAQQMKSKFVAKYDYDGRKSMQLREEWWRVGRQEGWTFLFYHDIKNPILSNPVNS